MSKARPVKKQRPVNDIRKHGFAAHPENICRNNAAKSKGHEVSNYFRAWLEATPDGLDCSRLDALLTYLWDIASGGQKQSVEAIKLLLERGYGKPAQTITDTDGNAIAPLYVRLDASMESKLKAGK